MFSVLLSSAALEVKEIAKRLNLHQMTYRPWAIYGACATSGDGICDSMESLAKLVKQFKSKNR